MIKNNTLLFLELFLLICIGLCLIYSSSNVWALYRFNDSFYFLKRQIVFALFGLIGMFICSKININKIKKYNKLLLLIGIFSLIVVLIPAIGVERNGSRSWFAIGSFLLQPSEFYKLIVIFYISEIMEKKKKIKTIHDFKVPLLLLGITFFLILLQPDFGSGMVIVCSIIFMLFYMGVPYKYFIYLFLIGVLGLSFLIISAPYRLERILSFLNPWSDPLGSGFQIIQSLYAISPGGLLGVGIGDSIQKQFYLPEPQTDFIFAIFAEEFGFIGCVFLLLLLFMIVVTSMKIIKQQQNKYNAYVGLGIISVFVIQVMINLGVVVGLFPVTGITLPFLSYGGSSLIIMMSMFGFILGMKEE